MLSFVLIFSTRSQYQKGKKWIDKVLDQDPENLDAIIVKAWVTMEEGDLTLAEKFYQRALQRDPRNAEVLYYYGKYWQKRGEDQNGCFNTSTTLGQVLMSLSQFCAAIGQELMSQFVLYSDLCTLILNDRHWLDA